MAGLLHELSLAFVRLHILHHAVRAPVFGVGLMRELRRHGYRLGPGTLYPILHALEAEGYLTRLARVEDGRRRKYYSATARGRRLLEAGRARAAELMRELGGLPRPRAAPPRPAGRKRPAARKPKAAAPRRKARRR